MLLNSGVTCLCSDCMSFTECNSYPTTFVDFDQYVVQMMSLSVHSDKLQICYTQIALFEFPLYFQNKPFHFILSTQNIIRSVDCLHS